MTRDELRDQIARALHDHLRSDITWEKVTTFSTLRECADARYAEADAALAVVWPLLERRCTCDGDPIECGHEAARGVAEEAHHQAGGRAEQAISLLRTAMTIRMYGERAPGGNENWADWDRETEAFLRSIAADPQSSRPPGVVPVHLTPAGETSTPQSPAPAATDAMSTSPGGSSARAPHDKTPAPLVQGKGGGAGHTSTTSPATEEPE